MAKAVIFAAVLFVSSCTGVRSVQVQPPISTPPGLVSGYGVEKVAGRPERARQAAYLSALDDLLTHSAPILVSKTDRVLESTFRLRASSLLQPHFKQTGLDHGFVWVLLATTEDDIQRGWQQFLVWRAERIDEAQSLFNEAKGPERAQLLKASLALLDDAGAADDSSMLYYQVKTAYDVAVEQVSRLEKFQKEFRMLTDSGRLAAAETMLEEAQRAGLEQDNYQKCVLELSERRAQALQFIQAGDDLLREEHYKEARARYEQARKIDRDNTLVAGKIEMAERFDREARARAVRATVGFVIPVAVRTIGDYFEYKSEQERRKREEEIRKRKEAERAAEEKRNKTKQEQQRSEQPPENPHDRSRRPHRIQDP
jgi:tetratricopeptide (TPR) repeat protein